MDPLDPLLKNFFGILGGLLDPPPEKKVRNIYERILKVWDQICPPYNKAFTPSKMRFYWEQMLEATAAIHEKGIVHADIKPANFLMIKAKLFR